MAGKVEILIIDNDRQTADLLSSQFRQKGYNPFGVYTGKKGLELALNDVFDLIILDMTLPDIDSLELLKKIKGSRVSAPVIILTTEQEIESAVEATRLGAYSFVEKPLNKQVILHITQNALSRFRLEQDLHRLQHSLSNQYDFIGRSAIIEQFREKLRRIAMSSSRVLFIGEPGSGKLVAAKYVHYSSNRATEPFAVVNCAVVDQANSILRLDNELFGYEKGAFVGATQSSKGKLELADGGTLFLDEVGALGPDQQAKLLRTIESGAIQRLGSSDEIKVDVRILAASRLDLETKVKAGGFREDLYFRLNVIPVIVPPLRSHREDIPLLVRHFLDRAGFIHKQIEREAIDYLKSYQWPGNIRELKDFVKKAAARTDKDTISLDDTKAALAENQNLSNRNINALGDQAIKDIMHPVNFQPGMSLRQLVIDYEKRLLTDVLNRCNGNITKAASMLKTDRGNLSKKLKKLGFTNIKKD